MRRNRIETEISVSLPSRWCIPSGHDSCTVWDVQKLQVFCLLLLPNTDVKSNGAGEFASMAPTPHRISPENECYQVITERDIFWRNQPSLGSLRGDRYLKQHFTIRTGFYILPRRSIFFCNLLKKAREAILFKLQVTLIISQSFLFSHLESIFYIFIHLKYLKNFRIFQFNIKKKPLKPQEAKNCIHCGDLP